MKIISVFNGISCGRVAFGRANIPVKRYASFEIDKYCNLVAKANYPNDEYNGDVFEADFTQYKGFDILIGGSPCTHWSIAKQGRETTSSGIGWELFMQYVRALRESECKWFLYENNYSIHKDIQAAISRELGVEPIMINSALVSAQNRKRLYWTNILGVEQPADKGIFLKDILESGIAHKEKSYCLRASYGEHCGNRNLIENLKGNGFGYQGVCEPITDREKSLCITASYSKAVPQDMLKGRRTQVFVLVEEASYELIDGATIFVTNRAIRQGDSAGTKQGKYVYLPSSPKSNTSTAGQLHNEKIIVPKPPGIWKTIYLVRNGNIEIAGKMYKIDLPDGDYIIRKLTVKECCRLQTLPEDYFIHDSGDKVVSDTQAYKCLGNGWTVDVIAHILSYLPTAAPQPE